MDTIENTNLKFQEMIRKNLKVNNPALLKTGTLGTIANIFGNVKYDTAGYYQKLLKETNPATLTEFNSLLFHSSLMDYNIEFSTPAISEISIIIPDVHVQENYIQIYTIKQNSILVDKNGLNYTLEKDIKVYLTTNKIQAKEFINGKINQLEVDTIPNPQNTSTNIHLVKIQGLKQYKRTIEAQIIPNFGFGSSYVFSLPIDQIKNIYSIEAFLQKDSLNKEELSVFQLSNSTSDKFGTDFGLERLNIKYSKFNSSQFQNDLYIGIKENLIQFEVGNGIEGQKLNLGDKVIVDVKTTNGEEGNTNSIDINVENVLIEIENEFGIVINSHKANIKMISLTGGENGKDIAEIKELRTNMINKSKIQKSLTTLNDYEVQYTIDSGIPFVDPKFFNSQNHIFIYNIMRDEKNNIIDTCTFNIEDDIFQESLFFPTKTYEGKELISPFYYKRERNHYISYLVNPRVVFDIFSINESGNQTLQNNIDKIQDNFEIQLLYSYFDRRSKIKLLGINPGYTYEFKSNLFNMEFNVFNNYELEINQRFLDKYCILEEDLKDIRITVLNESKEKVSLFASYSNYNQLEELQKHFYYTKLDRFDSTKETKIVLGLPYLDIGFFNRLNGLPIYRKIKSFFRINQDKEIIPFNIKATQSLYNTIQLDEQYKDYIIKRNNGGSFLNTKNQLVLEVLLDSQLYTDSDFENISEFEYHLQNKVYKIVKQFEGFETEFYETVLEKEISNEFPMITNIDVITPRVFEINSSDDIYRGMEKALGTSNGITLFDLINFVPPYFFFDFSNINIKIELI